MNWSALATAFGLVFLAEMGDKTQLAVITLTARTEAPVSVFLGASAALVAVTLVGAFLGGVVTRFVPADLIQKIAAAAFIVVGVVMLLRPD
jgi:Ca2+/H+ antiporter, TMEM165/GDT1 family